MTKEESEQTERKIVNFRMFIILIIGVADWTGIEAWICMRVYYVYKMNTHKTAT